MAPRVSVIVPVRGGTAHHHLDRCFGSLLTQTLGQEQLEMVAVDVSGGDSGAARWLDAFALHRAQVRVVPYTEGVGAEEGVARSIGDYVLVLDPAHHLAPEALERLLRTAEEDGADTVHGRSAGGGDGDPGDGPGDGPCILRRRSSLGDGPRTASAVTDYDCHYPEDQEARPASRVVLRQSPAAPVWDDGVLLLTGTASLSHTAPSPQEVRLLLRTGGEGGTEITVPAETGPDGDYRATIDPARAAGPRLPLADGNWTVRIRVIAGGLTRTAWLCAADPMPAPVPYLAGGGSAPVVPVAAYASVPHHHLNLDVGARRHPLGADARAVVTRRFLRAPYLTAAVTLPGCTGLAELDLLLVGGEERVVLEDLSVTRHPGDRFTVSAPLGAVGGGAWELFLRVAAGPFVRQLPLAPAEGGAAPLALTVPSHWRWTRRLIS
ncbi:glycosyltransferase family 2 protein [Streptomyces sp. NPDC021093]|uniref:glycosyltransferase family 2 protein n=1 Tax=Streptomyces sp. NPDC021093 TaxID=3365112 RepID=UPI00379F6C59